MVKSRSRSPRWKPGPPIHKSPEYHRHRQEYDHHRNSRRPIEWENERHRHNNSRNDTYNNFYDHMHEPSSFDFDFKRSEFDATNHIRRTYSPERQGESNRRFSAKYNEVMDYREHNRNFHDNRIHEKNIHNNNEHNNGFKAERRWGNFDRPHRERDRDWHDNDHWNEHDHPNQYSSPPRRRPEEFEERESFQKRYHDDDYREYEQPHKRAREAGQYDYQPSQRSSHWKDDHREGPYYGKDWQKEVDYRHSNPIHEKQSGHLTKIEYDYGHRSPSYVHTEHNLLDDHAISHSRHEERKLAHAKTSYKTDGNSQERRRYKERSSEPLSKCNSRKDDSSNSFKNDANIKHLNHKHMEKGNKEEQNWKKKEDKSRKDPITTHHLRSQTPDPKVVLKITPEKKVVDNFGLKKSSDKYRPPQEHKNMSKDLPPKSEAIQGPRTTERKQVLGEDLKKRSNSNSKDRHSSQDLLVVAGNEKCNPDLGHLPQSIHNVADKPGTEFNQELITIIHEVKANHFKSSGMSLHERFSKLHSESNKEELNFDNSTLKPNPEIHRRIDMSLEELQKKSLHKTLGTQTVSHKLIEDPNDLRHDIERRRKKRLHSDQNGTANASFANSYFSGSYCGLENPEDEEGFSFSRERRSPFEESTGRHPVKSSYYRRNSNQCYSSRSNFEETNETRRPYKGWGNAAARI